MTYRRTLKTQYALSLATGTFALVLGYQAFEHRPLGNYWWAIALLFVAAGVYTILRARPFYRSVESLKEMVPVEMLLTIIPSGGSTRGDTDSWLLLRFAEPAASPLEEITIQGVDVSVAWLEQSPKNKKVMVYGALNERGPVLVEADGQFTWPSSSGAVTRIWRPNSSLNPDAQKRRAG